MAGNFWQPSHIAPLPKGRQALVTLIKQCRKEGGEQKLSWCKKTYWQMLGFAYVARTSNIP